MVVRKSGRVGEFVVVTLDERGDRVHEVRESFRRSVWAGALHAVCSVSTIWPLVHLRGVEHGGVNWSLVSGTKGKRACRLLETLAHGCGSTNSPRLCLEETNSPTVRCSVLHWMDLHRKETGSSFYLLAENSRD